MYLYIEKRFTCDDLTEFVLVVSVAAEEVGQAHDHQAQDGDADAEPLADGQAPPQERHREQAGEYDDGSAQHLEAGGARHVECWETQKGFFIGHIPKRTLFNIDYIIFTVWPHQWKSLHLTFDRKNRSGCEISQDPVPP